MDNTLEARFNHVSKHLVVISVELAHEPHEACKEAHEAHHHAQHQRQPQRDHAPQHGPPPQGLSTIKSKPHLRLLAILLTPQIPPPPTASHPRVPITLASP